MASLYLLISWLLLGTRGIIDFICEHNFTLRSLSSLFGVRDLIILTQSLDIIFRCWLPNTGCTVILRHRQVQIEGHLLRHASDVLEYDRGRFQVRLFLEKILLTWRLWERAWLLLLLLLPLFLILYFRTRLLWRSWILLVLRDFIKRLRHLAILVF